MENTDNIVCIIFKNRITGVAFPGHDFCGFAEGKTAVHGTDMTSVRHNIRDFLVIELENVADPDRTARFRCCMALVLPDGREFVTEGAMEGIIAREPKGINGFGYDPILFIPEYNRTSAEKNNISHRGEALRKMIEVIKKELN